MRKRILATPAIASTQASDCEIHVLTCEADWVNLLWTLKSFYLVSERQYRLCIHEDGTLTEAAVLQLKQHFPKARLVRRAEADVRAEALKTEFPSAYAFRNKHPLSLKLIDFSLFLECDRMLVLDSDVLFFEMPGELLSRIEDPEYKLNSFNEDVDTAYSLDRLELEGLLGFPLLERFNSGLGLVHKASVQMDVIESLLNLPNIQEGHFWRIEQTLYAVASCRFGAELLPGGYQVTLTPGSQNRPARHYVGAVRHQFYGEGIRRLVNETAIL